MSPDFCVRRVQKLPSDSHATFSEALLVYEDGAFRETDAAVSASDPAIGFVGRMFLSYLSPPKHDTVSNGWVVDAHSLLIRPWKKIHRAGSESCMIMSVFEWGECVFFVTIREKSPDASKTAVYAADRHVPSPDGTAIALSAGLTEKVEAVLRRIADEGAHRWFQSVSPAVGILERYHRGLSRKRSRATEAPPSRAEAAASADRFVRFVSEVDAESVRKNINFDDALFLRLQKSKLKSVNDLLRTETVIEEPTASPSSREGSEKQSSHP